jgi:ABC-2 type transport system ATP-binding protein
MIVPNHMQPAIELTDVTKVFGRFTAVDALTLAVPKGSMFGLLGPNGAGKTTTIRMIMNITAPDSGEIRILGHPMDRQTQNRIGYLPEERGLYRKMKVIDHLLFLAAIKEVPRETARERIARWTDRMELRPWLGRKVDELSKGMQQKVQFISTIVHDPEILILDEPFSGLDPLNVAIMRDYFLEFRAQGRTIVFSTHVLEQAEKLCDEICLLARSKKILEGGMKELKRRYSKDLLRLSIDASLAEVGALPGVASAQAFDGTYVISLAAGTDRQEFLRRTLERYRIDAFSQKEPDLEEIYIEAVRSAGLGETQVAG